MQDAIRSRFFSLQEKKIKDFLLTAISISTFATILALLALFVGSQQIANLIKFPENWIWSIVIASYLHGLFYTLLAVFQFESKKKSFAVTQLNNAFFTLTFAIYFLLMNYSWQGVITARIIGLFVSVTLSAYFFLPKLKTKFKESFNKNYCKELIVFSLKYLPAGLIPVLIPLSDRLAITYMVNISETGLFGIGSLFGMALTVLISGFIYALQPLLFRSVQKTNDQGKKDSVQLSRHFYLLLIPTSLLLIAVSYIVSPLLIGDKFSNASSYVTWMIISAAAQGAFIHNQTYLHSLGKITQMSFFSIIVIILNLILNAILIPKFGGIGAAYATLISYTIGLLINGLNIVIKNKKEKSFT